MQDRLLHAGHSDPDSIHQFGEQLSASLSKGTFVRLVLSHPARREGCPERILGRCVSLKGKAHLSVTLRYPTRDEVKNVPLDESVSWILSRLQAEFRSALLCTTDRDWQVSVLEGQFPRLIQHRPSNTVPPSRDHNHLKHSLLDETATDWLCALHIRDVAGQLRASMADKFRQISRYTEILSHLAKDCWADRSASSPARQPVIADMGCGKGYLTFGAWHLLNRVLKIPARVIGVEQRSELVTSGNRIAAELGMKDLEFLSGTIETVQLPPLDVLIALHACDTATDRAIERGIHAGARLIVVAPCCHQELRPKLGRPDLLAPLLRHGLFEERLAEWLTDGLRTLFLEWAGYQTRVIEFVSSEHTPKNVMIAAIRHGRPVS